MPLTFRYASAAAPVVLAILMAGCGNDSPKGGTQVAAKVNDGEITVHQINFAMQRIPGLTAEHAPQARKEILERLIDQELLVQQAQEMDLHRNPQTLHALEASRKEVLARAYLERTVRPAKPPDEAEVKKFFAENPGLFSGRQIYRFNEIVIVQRPANWDELMPALAKVGTLQEALDLLKKNGVDPSVASNVIRASEQLPLDLVPRFAQRKAKDVVIYQLGAATVIGEIQSIEPSPIAEEKAGPLIQQFLQKRERGDLARSEIKRLRETAEVSYLGDFSAPSPATPAAVETPAAGAPAAPAAQGRPQPGEQPSAPGGTESSGKSSFSEGIRGLR